MNLCVALKSVLNVLLIVNRTKIQIPLGDRHSSVVSSAPSILRPWVWIPSMPCFFGLNCGNWNCIGCWNEKTTKINEKEAIKIPVISFIIITSVGSFVWNLEKTARDGVLVVAVAGTVTDVDVDVCFQHFLTNLTPSIFRESALPHVRKIIRYIAKRLDRRHHENCCKIFARLRFLKRQQKCCLPHYCLLSTSIRPSFHLSLPLFLLFLFHTFYPNWDPIFWTSLETNVIFQAISQLLWIVLSYFALRQQQNAKLRLGHVHTLWQFVHKGKVSIWSF